MTHTNPAQTPQQAHQHGTAQANLRANLRAGDDEQAGLTRSRLIGAFRSATTERIPRLSAVWLCERAGVARSTFYTHYATVDELAADAITASFAEVSAGDVELRVGVATKGERIARNSITRIGLDKVLEAFEASHPLIDYAIEIGSRPTVTERIIERFAAYTRNTIAAEYSELSASAVALASDYVSAGTAHAMLSWLLGPGDVSRDDLLTQLVDLLPQRLTARDTSPHDGSSPTSPTGGP